MSAPARIPVAGLSPTAQAALALVEDWREQSTSLDAYLVRTWVLPDGRYITTLSRDSQWIAEVQSHTAGTAQGAHRAMVETLRQGLGPSAPTAPATPAPSVLYAVWCTEGDVEDLHGPLQWTREDAEAICASMQREAPRYTWRVRPVDVAVRT